MRSSVEWLACAAWALTLCRGDKWPKDAGYKIKDGDSFPYIVVGAGAGGSVVASRLAQSGRRVLLLEAGGDPSALSRVPGAAQALLGGPEDWQYPTRPDGLSCLASRGRACRFSRGKALGGSTATNYMMYTRGHRSDFPELRPYMLRSEGLRDLHLLPPSSRRHHCERGPMALELFPDSGNVWAERIVAGLRDMGFPLNPDVNGDSQIGVSEIVGYVYRGERMSAARAYLTRPDVQENLLVLKRARAVRVIIRDGVAEGITLFREEQNVTLNLFAEKEVILSAGTIGTTQLLLESGVGPAEHLRARNVTVAADLPVGRGMRDHVLPLLFLRVERGLPAGADLLFGLGLQADQVARYLATKDGPLASNGLTQVTAFLNTDCFDWEADRLTDDRPECDVPNAQLIFAYIDRGLLAAAAPFAATALNLDAETLAQLAAANAESALIVVSPVLLSPRSEGRVELAEARGDSPDIFPGYLQDPRDLEQMVTHVALVERLARRLGPLLRLRWAACAEGAEYWRCYCRHMTSSVFHATGTTAAARDGRLRVLRRLRVGDASALARLPRGNTEAAVLALGEMLADFLIEDDRTRHEHN